MKTTERKRTYNKAELQVSTDAFEYKADGKIRTGQLFPE